MKKIIKITIALIIIGTLASLSALFIKNKAKEKEATFNYEELMPLYNLTETSTISDDIVILKNAGVYGSTFSIETYDIENQMTNTLFYFEIDSFDETIKNNVLTLSVVKNGVYESKTYIEDFNMLIDVYKATEETRTIIKITLFNTSTLEFKEGDSRAYQDIKLFSTETNKNDFKTSSYFVFDYQSKGIFGTYPDDSSDNGYITKLMYGLK